MTLVAASLISTRTKLWLIADASLGVSVFLFFSHFSPGCTDISLYNTLSYCIYYIDIVHIYIQRYFYLLCCQLPLHVWIWASTYELFLFGPVGFEDRGRYEEAIAVFEAKHKEAATRGGQMKGTCTRQNIRKDVEDREKTHVFPRKIWFRWCTLWWSLT